MSKSEFCKEEIKYLEQLVSGQGISSMKWKIKAITNLAPTTNITEAKHIIGLIGYYRKFFPIFSDTIRPLNELTRKNVQFKWIEQYKKSLDYIKQVITTTLFWFSLTQISSITFLWTVASILGVAFLYNM